MQSGVVVWGLLLLFVASNNELEEPYSVHEYEQRRLHLKVKKNLKY